MKTLKKALVLMILIAPIFAFAKTTKAKVVKKVPTAIIKVQPATPINNNRWSVPASNSTSAAQDSVSSKMSASAMMPIYNTSKTYTFDATALKKIADSKSTLLKINCNGSQILKDFGLDQKTSTIFSIGASDNNFDYTFDLKSCSLRGSKTNQQTTSTLLTEAQALKAAKEFMASKYLTKKIFAQYGDPIILSKNTNVILPMYKDSTWPVAVANSETSTTVDLSGIEIDPTDTWDVNVNPQYVSFTILFPYSINDQRVYNNYGGRAGISLTVTSEWVTSINAQLLPFKWAVRTADKMSADDFSGYIAQGGNNPYRGTESTVSLGKPQQVLILFSLRRNNVTEMYLSSWIKFTTNIKQDQRTQQNYEMTLSDYKIGNNNYGY